MAFRNPFLTMRSGIGPDSRDFRRPGANRPLPALLSPALQPPAARSGRLSMQGHDSSRLMLTAVVGKAYPFRGCRSTACRDLSPWLSFLSAPATHDGAPGRALQSRGGRNIGWPGRRVITELSHGIHVTAGVGQGLSRA